LRQYIAIGLKWWWLVALMSIVAAATGYLVSVNQTPVYQATNTVIVGQSIQASDPTTADLMLSERLARTYADIARRQPVLQGVVDTLSLQDSWQGLRERVTVTPVRDTQLLEIKIEANSPDEARVTADEVAQQLIRLSPTSLQNQANAESREYIHRRIENLQSEIEAGQARLTALDEAMTGSVSAEQVQEIQAEMNDMESLITEWENNHTQLLILVESSKSPNYLAVIEPAQAGSRPIRPKIQQNTLLAAVVGLLLALGVVFLVEYLDDTLKSKTDLGEALDLTPLGAISRIKGKDYPDKLIAINDVFAPVGEAFRMIRSNIQFSAVDRPIRSIMITSATPNEGKSITVANLGVVMAQAGLRTIIIDADLRRPVQHQIFQIAVPGGLTDLLCTPEAEPGNFLRPTNIDNLRVLTCGAIPPNPSELLGSQRMEQVLVELGGLADILLFDSPPALMVADAAVLSNRVDGVVLVTKVGSTRLSAARQAVLNLRQAGANLLGGVLNQVKSHSSGYYYHQGYYYAPYSPNGHGRKKKQTGPGSLSGFRLRLPFLKK
ncbi:MAG: polysaccharide biosynthesis tyrosine autokinase, partial [Chloroflexota bacterium]